MATPANPSLGSLLRRYRLASALSQEELAARSGVSVRAISDLERGVRSTARLETVRLLVEALGLPAADRGAMIAAATSESAAYGQRERSGDITSQLPDPPNPLIGRDAMVREVVSLFEQGRTRLLTLTGPGGVGKTRLAIEAAAQIAAQLDVPVVFVPLAPVSDAARVPEAIAQGLGVASNVASPGEQLLSFLAQRRLLLVLDNMEHLPESAPFIAGLSEEAPNVLILVTGRARLRLSAEQELRVPPLDLPDSGASDDEIQHAAAVRLFMARAAAATGWPAPLPGDPKLNAAICRRLDGLPLSLELAASRLRVMPPRTLLEMLEQRLPVLTGGSRDLPDRQQSMRAAIAWSYELLDPNQQALFRWLSVFVGGFSSNAVAYTGPAIALDAVEAFDALDGLLDSGLVERDAAAAGQPRFRMLETIREFGIEQLMAKEELGNALLAFARFALDVIGDGYAAPWEPYRQEWLDRVSADEANVAAALDWTSQPETGQLCMELVAKFGSYWDYNGPYREFADRLRHAATFFPSTPSRDLATALFWVADLSMYARDFVFPRDLCERMLEIARTIDDRLAEAAALHLLGWNAEMAEQWEQSTAYFEQALVLWKLTGMSWMEGQILMLLGGHAYVRGNLVNAREMEESALRIFRHQAADEWIGAAEWYIGFLDVAEGKLRDAALRFRASAVLWIESGHLTHRFKPLVHLAHVAALVDEVELAATLVGAADAVLERSGAALFPFDIPAWEHATESSRRVLGEERFCELHRAGRSLDHDDWLDLAAAVIESAGEATPELVDKVQRWSPSI